MDSREVVEGSLFVGIRGELADGGQHAPDALCDGAAAAVVGESAWRWIEGDVQGISEAGDRGRRPAGGARSPPAAWRSSAPAPGWWPSPGPRARPPRRTSWWRCSARPGRQAEGTPGQPQHRGRRPDVADGARRGLRGRGGRDGHARDRPDRRARRAGAPRRGLRHRHRPGAPGAARHRGGRRRGEGRGAPGAAPRRPRRGARRRAAAGAPSSPPSTRASRSTASATPPTWRSTSAWPRGGSCATPRPRWPAAGPWAPCPRRAPSSRWRCPRCGGRSGRWPVGGVLIEDCYNANPVSMRAALADLAGRPGRRVAVLADMMELGPDEARYHREVGRGRGRRGHRPAGGGGRARRRRTPRAPTGSPRSTSPRWRRRSRRCRGWCARATSCC